ncbi:Dehydrogenase/reductase SDR family member 1 [Seminavis robusta]|uniref:Dehydrogenase/reductase SDR family member 1 n=1 Tax=Seminavis robusta TaxID=568900 RepID=A0A9N8D4M3_9STRA|nr:Dehydrogenase/reductase SDR family member 1 [Seminavis robusta]|eukprot:Sro3_g002570.1 Dehydrogenase/reductase SDR family member 1 (405) ;mRNA; f:193685-194899
MPGIFHVPFPSLILAGCLCLFFFSHEVNGLSSSSSWLSMTTATGKASTISTSSTNGRVAVVTGSSRGIGRGIALELGSAGYTVYCLGRSSSSSGSKPVPGQRPVAAGLDVTVESAAQEVTQRGGIGHAVPCDLSRDGVMEDFLEELQKTEGRLDLLVCSAYSTPTAAQSLRGEFWKQGMDMWDAVNGLGLRQVYAACRAAAPLLIDTANNQTNASSDSDAPPPLICLVSSFGGKSYTFNVAYGIGKAAIDRMATDMSYQLAKYGVATTSLYPGLVKTEANLQMQVDGTWDEASGNLDLSQGESPEFSGRALAQLASLPKDQMMERSGQVEVVAELAKEFGFTDVDGTQLPSIRSLRYLLPNFVFPQIEKEAGKPVPDWLKNNVPDILLPWSTFSSGPPPEMDTR